MGQDALNGGGVFDGLNGNHSLVTLGALQSVVAERAFEKLSPGSPIDNGDRLWWWQLQRF
jgi:hypothetical protein